MSITAYELKKLHMAADRGEALGPNLDTERLYMKLCEFGGIVGYVVDLLVGAGFTSISLLKDASDAELEAISGIGRVRVAQIRELLG